MFNKRVILGAFIVVAFTVQPFIGGGAGHVVHAATGPHAQTCANGASSNGDITIGNVAGTPQTFPSGCYTNAGTGAKCTATPIGVTGSSAIAPYINAAAQQYCNQFGIDVEYVSKSSCIGVDFAADSATGNAVGVSDVFGGACTGGSARKVGGTYNDRTDTVNVVNSIIRCPSSSTGTPTIPKGGTQASLLPGGAVECANQNGAAVTDGPPGGSGNYCAPNDLGQLAAQQLWQDFVPDWGNVGGTPAANCGGGFGVSTHNRSGTSGTRITWCFNIFNGVDNCGENATDALGAPLGLAPGTPNMLNDICGNSFTGAAPRADVGTAGYVSRADVLVDPRGVSSTPSRRQTLQNCGLIPLDGHTGWNGTCNPNAAANTSSSCPGDADVQNGLYRAWGYIHFDYNKSQASGSVVVNFINWVETSNTSQQVFQDNGFIRSCKMNFTRSADGAPYQASPTSFPAAPCQNLPAYP